MRRLFLLVLCVSLLAVSPARADHPLIVTASNGAVLDVPGGTMLPAVLIAYQRHGRDNQQWRAAANADGSLRLLSVRSGLALSAMGNTDGTVVAQWPWTRGGAYQRWAHEGGKLRNTDANLCAQTGAQITLAPCENATTWTLSP